MRSSRVVKSYDEIKAEAESEAAALAIIAEQEAIRERLQAQYDAVPATTPYTRQD